MKCEDCCHAEMCRWIDELEGRGCDFGESCDDAISRETIEDIKAEIVENQNIVNDALHFDKKHEFYNGKWAGIELALEIIDKHTKVEMEVQQRCIE